MSVLTDEAEQARVAAEAADAAEVQAKRDAMKAEATEALRAVLTRPDGTKLGVAASKLQIVADDLMRGQVVVSDGTVSLGFKRAQTGAWECRVVAFEDGEWAIKSREPVTDLATLGTALREAV